jgi:hypothetical protein
MKTPPLLPEETLQRVLRVANLDGLSVMGIAGFLTLLSAAAGDYQGAGVGLLVTAAGAIELHGMGLLRAGEKRGMSWVIASQPYLFLVLTIYCVERILAYDPIAMREQMNAILGWLGNGSGDSDSVPQALASGAMFTDQSLKRNYLLGYGLLIVGTLIFQGRMTFFYWQRRAAVAAALETDEIGENLDSVE